MNEFTLWLTPADIGKQLLSRLSARSLAEMGEVPPPSGTEGRDFGKKRGWMFRLSSDRYFFLVALLDDGRLIRAEAVQDAYWRDISYELPNLIHDPKFRSTFERLVEYGPAHNLRGLQLTYDIVADENSFRQFNSRFRAEE